jgi:rhodanese-related sulfurtransferase
MIDVNIGSLSPEEFKKYKLIDIREPQEYAQLPALTDQVEYIPFSQFPANADAFKKGESYLLVCAMGGRSHYMAEALEYQGIKALSVNYGISSLNAYLTKHGHASH